MSNDLGLDGFAFVEFCGPDPKSMAKMLENLGFVATDCHPYKPIRRFRQGEINFILHDEATHHAAQFAKTHGPSACGMGFFVDDPNLAFNLALSRGAQASSPEQSALGSLSFVLNGIGGLNLYLVSREGLFCDWLPIEGAARDDSPQGLKILDHLTHNVHRGQMRVWSGFYAKVFGFEEQKYFDIKGQSTGLFSQAMIAPDGQIRIPLNESKDAQSQIEEYLRDYNGEGIQHIALTTDDIYQTIEWLKSRGIKFQSTPETYYELVDARIPHHGEDLERLKANNILIDGDVEREGLLLQIFTENTFGPIFFEIIQRKGNQGFGNGNFQALFESIELDQIRRGIIADPNGTLAQGKTYAATKLLALLSLVSCSYWLTPQRSEL